MLTCGYLCSSAKSSCITSMGFRFHQSKTFPAGPRHSCLPFFLVWCWYSLQFYPCWFFGCLGYAGQSLFLNRNMLQSIFVRTHVVKNNSLRSFECFQIFTYFPLGHTKYLCFLNSNSIYRFDRKKKKRITDRCSYLVVMLTVSQYYHATDTQW
jgi:hypothetical protein